MFTVIDFSDQAYCAVFCDFTFFANVLQPLPASNTLNINVMDVSHELSADCSMTSRLELFCD